MNITLTEGIIIAVLTGLVSILGAMKTAKVQSRTTTKDMFTALCASQQARIAQLQLHIEHNESEIERLEGLLDEVRSENARLQVRIMELEHENKLLREQIADMTLTRS